MFRIITVYWYRAFDFRDNATEKVANLKSRVIESVSSLRADLQNSPSIFDRSPIDAIWDQKLSELERRHLKANGFRCPPIRPAYPPHGYIRVEYYTSMKRIHKRKRWSCWEDVPLLSTGELDVAYVRKMWGFEPNRFAIVDPVREKEFYPANQDRLSPIGIYLNTRNGEIPLRFVEPNPSTVTKVKRTARAISLMVACMLNSLFQLIIFHEAVQEYQFVAPPPRTYVSFYNLIRGLQPRTIQYSKEPSYLSIGESHMSFDSDLEADRKSTEGGRIGNWLWFIVKFVVIAWLVVAELTSSGIFRRG